MSENPPSPFLRKNDVSGVAGPPRELTGYGEHLPMVRWTNDAKVAINIVVNLEEGSEKSYAMGDGVNEEMHELPFHQYVSRDLAKESFFEYGSRAGPTCAPLFSSRPPFRLISSSFARFARAPKNCISLPIRMAETQQAIA